ncbi:hypothetical protein [Roseovarius faecimaris]|nr:hypothetical protein [Roseovarius faecimaris]
MRLKTWLASACAALMLVACGTVNDETGYTGGAFGRLADERLFQARSMAQRADRYLMSLTLIAPIAAELAQTEAEAKSMSIQINKAYDILGRMNEISHSCVLQHTSCKSVDTPTNSAFAFEKNSYDMQRTLYALAKQSSDAADLDDLIDDIIDLDLAGLLNTGKRTFPILRRVFATYRDTVVTFGSAVYSVCSDQKRRDPDATSSTDCDTLGALLAQMSTGQIAKTGLLAEHERRTIRATLTALDGAALERWGANWHLQKSHALGLVYHVDAACIRLRAMQKLGADDDEDLEEVINCAGEDKLHKSQIKASAKRSAYIAAISKRAVPLLFAEPLEATQVTEDDAPQTDG